MDEAHNLVDRSREMYSADLYKEDVLAVKRIMKAHSRTICRILDKCNKAMLEMKRECEHYQILDSVGTLTFHLMRLASQMDEFWKTAGISGEENGAGFLLCAAQFPEYL